MKLITEFASSALHFDPNALLEQLSAYPTRTRGDQIEWGACQWVDGTHSALNYRGHALRRAKIWCQRGDPRAFFRKYYYTGWQWRVLPATCAVAACPELAPIWDAYDAWCDANGVMRANHAIVTRYADGSHGIGAHSDKPKSIAPSVPGQTSMITVVKLGPAARRFLVTDLEGAPLFDEIVAPGTAIMMSLEANLQTKHAVPEVDDAGPSGSIVFRTITDTVAWGKLERQIARMDAKEAAAAEAAAAAAAADE